MHNPKGVRCGNLNRPNVVHNLVDACLVVGKTRKTTDYLAPIFSIPNKYIAKPRYCTLWVLKHCLCIGKTKVNSLAKEVRTQLAFSGDHSNECCKTHKTVPV